jgi:hypothetical protein
MEKIRNEINSGKEVVFDDAIIHFNNKKSYTDKVLRVDDKINTKLIYVVESQILNPQLN